MSDIEKWGDAQQYRAEPHASYAGPSSGVMPTVRLLWMTPDPLGAIGAMAAMYEGRVVRELSELSHEDRVRYWKEVRSTHLDTPLEAVSFQFLLEGVDRSFTHQLVRKRVGAAYAQESLRFAVPGRLSEATSLPPSLQGTSATIPPDAATAGVTQAQGWREDWEQALEAIDQSYHALVASGMPAEEARGILPHCTATRVQWHVNLRSLLQEAGNRLCTQAQFHWKMVFGQLVNAIKQYPQSLRPRFAEQGWPEWNDLNEQYGLIVRAFQPVCYEKGRCPFGATFDRDCTIRSRVEWKAKRGVPSSEWDQQQEWVDDIRQEGVDISPWAKAPRVEMVDGKPVVNSGPAVSVIPAIRTEEWLLNPGAARKVD